MPGVGVRVVGLSALLAGLLAATPATADSGFTSKRYGYRFAPGPGFYPQLALRQWRGAFPFGGDPGVDTFLDFHERKFIAAAMPVPASTTLSEWAAKHEARMESFCKPARAFRRTTLGGEPAREFLDACPDHDVIVVTAIHARRGYIFQFVSPTKNPPSADRRAYDVGRRTFRFLA